MCGLPVVDSFDEIEAEGGPAKSEEYDAPQELVSAIPPEPEDGSDPVDVPEGVSRNKLVLIAVVAAIVVVGGFSLFMAKPWGPVTPTQHVTEDADLSMAGFPGVVQYLRSQDLVVNDDGKEYGPRAEKFVTAYHDHLKTISDKAQELEDSLQQYLNGAKVDDVAKLARTAVALRNELVSSADKVMLLTIQDDDVIAERRRLAVETQYLNNEVEILSNCWHTIGTEKDRSKATSAARKTLSDGLDGHSIEEWHKLFVNAHSSKVD